MTSQSIILFLGIILSANAYSKYGRSCKDIGCLPSEVCAMAYDSCSYSQRDGKDCGNYPTCKKSGNVGSSPGASLNPAPDNTRISHQSPSNYPPGPPIDPNNIFGNPNRNANPPPQWGNVPIFPNPTSHSVHPQPAYPQMPQYYPPQNPNYNPYAQQPFQPQQPFAFGFPPPQVPAFRTTTKSPSLWNQFLYNKSGGKKNSATQQLPPSIFIYIISAYAITILAIREYH